jgi:hypothetical protein
MADDAGVDLQRGSGRRARRNRGSPRGRRGSQTHGSVWPPRAVADAEHGSPPPARLADSERGSQNRAELSMANAHPGQTGTSDTAETDQVTTTLTHPNQYVRDPKNSDGDWSPFVQFAGRVCRTDQSFRVPSHRRRSNTSGHDDHTQRLIWRRLNRQQTILLVAGPRCSVARPRGDAVTTALRAQQPCCRVTMARNSRLW